MASNSDSETSYNATDSTGAPVIVTVSAGQSTDHTGGAVSLASGYGAVSSSGAFSIKTASAGPGGGERRHWHELRHHDRRQLRLPCRRHRQRRWRRGGAASAWPWAAAPAALGVASR